MQTKEQLLERLKDETKVFENPLIQHAFEKVDRADFLGEDYKVEAYEDYAIPTLKGQTMSQPTTVAFMLELLNAQKGDKVLNIGSGSGWTTGLLADIVGEKGEVLGIEIIPELVQMGKDNLAKYPYKNAKIISTKEKKSATKEKQFDKILVNASAEELPDEIVRELKTGGVLVIPINEEIVRIEKRDEKDYDIKNYPGFSFVPYVQE